MNRLGAPARVAIGLPLLLALVVAGIGITARLRGIDGSDGAGAAAAPDTRPLAVVPVDAPAAESPECAALLGTLPRELPSSDGPLPPRALAEPALPGVRAWAAAPRPAVLRCGLARPAELSPTSALLEVDGVSWLPLSEPGPYPLVTSYVVVDRPVYLVLTVPLQAGTGPLQSVSEAVRQTLPETPVAVR